jgi:hypothetical protein
MRNLHKTILTAIAVSLTLGYIWYGNRTITPKRAVWNDVLAMLSGKLDKLPRSGEWMV